MFNIAFTKSNFCWANARVPFHPKELPSRHDSRDCRLSNDAKWQFNRPLFSFMSFAIACMETGRGFLSIEKHSDCFKASVESLGIFRLLPVPRSRDSEQMFDINLGRQSPVQGCSKNEYIVQNRTVQSHPADNEIPSEITERSTQEIEPLSNQEFFVPTVI